MTDSRPGLPDGCTFWLTAASVFAMMGAIGITIAITEYHPPWLTAWFIAGAVVCALGVVAAIWAMVLYLAHKEAGRYWYDQPATHAQRPAQPEPATRPQEATAAVANAILTATGGGGLRDLARWLLPVLREISGDLRQAAAGIEKASRERSYSRVRREFDVGRTWDDNRQQLAALEGQGDLYDRIRDAYAGIARIHGIASFTGLTPTLSHDLPGVLEAIRAAESAVRKELAELG